ncbi:MAG TPA: phage holin family protein [Bacteroidia bacterium]|nr:phage holin family protein [Bacteroidia bacterium]
MVKKNSERTNHQSPITIYLRRMKFIIRILISTLAVLATAYLLPERMVHIDGFKTALLVALVLAFLNSVVKPILIILTIPVTVISLGLFLLVINAGIILLADYFIDGFQVHGFWAALIFSIVMTIINALFGNSDNNNNRQRNQYN